MDPDQQLMQMGKTIRSLRRQQGLSLQDLSVASGLSASFLSMVERGLSTLALTSVFNVATALNVDIEELLPRTRTRTMPHEKMEVTRNFARNLIPIAIGDREYRFLSAHIEGRTLEPLLVSVKPTTHAEIPYRHKGEEFAWVIKGELVYIVEGHEHILRPGDSIHVISSVSHALRNDTDETAEAVWVLSQPMVHESLGDLTLGHPPVDGE